MEEEVEAGKARGKGSVGWEVIWKYLLFLREMGDYFGPVSQTPYRINVHSFIAEVKLKRRR